MGNGKEEKVGDMHVLLPSRRIPFLVVILTRKS